MQVQHLNALVAQLLAARAQIDATLATLGVAVEEGEEVAEGEAKEGGCPHPPSAIQDLTTFDGGQKYLCTQCDAESNKPFPI